MSVINKNIVNANIKLQDENNVLKDDKRILNLKIEEKDKVINELLSRIAKLEYEVERQDNIINELEKYLDNLHWFKLGKKEENGNMEYFYASVSNFYEDTKNILKGSD